MRYKSGWPTVVFFAIAGIGISFQVQQASGQSRGKQRSEAPVSAWVRIAERQPTLLHASSEDEDFDVYFQTQIELIRSPLVLDQVPSAKSVRGLSLLKQQKNPSAWLARELTVVRKGNSELLVISLKASDRTQASKVVNAIVAAYFKANSRGREVRIRQKIEALKNEKPRRIERVLELRAELEKLAAEDGPEEPSSSDTEAATDQDARIRRVVDMSRSGLKAQATDLYMKLKTREAQRVELLKNRLQADAALPKEALDEQIAAHPEILDLEMMADDDFAKMEAIRTASVLGERHPEYEKISKSYAESKEALDARQESLRLELMEQRKEEVLGAFGKKVAQLDAEIKGYRLQLGVLTQQYFEQIHKDRSTDRKLLERAQKSSN